MTRSASRSEGNAAHPKAVAGDDEGDSTARANDWPNGIKSEEWTWMTPKERSLVQAAAFCGIAYSGRFDAGPPEPPGAVLPGSQVAAPVGEYKDLVTLSGQFQSQFDHVRRLAAEKEPGKEHHPHGVSSFGTRPALSKRRLMASPRQRASVGIKAAWSGRPSWMSSGAWVRRRRLKGFDAVTDCGLNTGLGGGISQQLAGRCPANVGLVEGEGFRIGLQDPCIAAFADRDVV